MAQHMAYAALTDDPRASDAGTRERLVHLSSCLIPGMVSRYLSGSSVQNTGKNSATRSSRADWFQDEAAQNQ